MMLFHLLILLISSLALIQATIKIIHALEKISHFFALRDFSIAFILMAVATSLPELFVGITSAVADAPALSLGNVLGSNIVNLTLVIGLVVLVSGGINARSIIVRRDALYMAVFATVPILMLLDGLFSRIDSIIVLVFYFLYLTRLLSQRTAFKERHNHVTAKEALLNFWIFIAGVAVLLLSAEGIVFASKRIALDLGIALSLVGMFFVSLGTSLPEIVFELKAVKRNQSGLALGDLVGSVVANATLVLGVTGLIRPIEVDFLNVFLAPVIYLLVALLIFEVFVRTDKKLVSWEGLLLVLMYIMFLLTEIGLQYYRPV
ncbi:sodium:calcium antiporter [Patescibacteria group bacterium]|nr:sodium:calcium antiporter [Patescibacteria group bacterium]